MASLDACRCCHRTLKKTMLGGAFFPAYTCLKCKVKYYSACGGTNCPARGATARGKYDETYAR